MRNFSPAPAFLARSLARTTAETTLSLSWAWKVGAGFFFPLFYFWSRLSERAATFWLKTERIATRSPSSVTKGRVRVARNVDQASGPYKSSPRMQDSSGGERGKFLKNPRYRTKHSSQLPPLRPSHLQVISKECALIRTAIKEEDEKFRHRNVAKLMFIHMLGKYKWRRA